MRVCRWVSLVSHRLLADGTLQHRIQKTWKYLLRLLRLLPAQVHRSPCSLLFGAGQSCPPNNSDETMAGLATGADEVLVERARKLRDNAGPNEHAYVTEFNNWLLGVA